MRPTGLLSVTFRSLPFERIIDLTVQAGLDGIEWGGDVHVPPGELKQAERIGQAARKAGLVNFAYGSYWRADCEPEMLAETAAALGVQWIRIWAGTQASADVSDDQFRRLSDEACLIADAAGREQIKVAFEWHKNSLTDTNQSAQRLLAQANHPNLYCLWQPTVALTPREFDLLECLMKNKNLVLSREQLLVRCWGYDFEGEARAVDTQIKRLREKLGAAAGCIKTVIKVGYKLEG